MNVMALDYDIQSLESVYAAVAFATPCSSAHGGSGGHWTSGSGRHSLVW
ncbi:MAG: hypothetical protein HOY79_48015 [Streptomyces sp.]|nr:hypothetical protein [Streptomyces sp.]